jgi:peptide chain release factor 1
VPLEIHHNLRRTLEGLDRSFESLSAELLDPEVAADHRRARGVAIRRAALEPLVARWREIADLERELDEAKALAAESDDAEMAALAREEATSLETRAASRLTTRHRGRRRDRRDHPRDQGRRGRRRGRPVRGRSPRDVPAVRGRAALERRGARCESWRRRWIQAGDPLGQGRTGVHRSRLRERHPSGQAGARDRERAFTDLAFESGTHQVKRVPATEAQGRIHTSTATVAVLPEPEEVEVDLDPDDVQESITTAQGPGGQNVNKVATAVHLIHRPTGIEVRMQETKSQTRNREKAWQLLRARLFARQQAEAAARRAEARSGMIGSASRSEKIRTYRFKENLVADHRLGESFNLGSVLGGEMQPLVDALRRLEVARRLEAL